MFLLYSCTLVCRVSCAPEKMCALLFGEVPCICLLGPIHKTCSIFKFSSFLSPFSVTVVSWLLEFSFLCMNVLDIRVGKLGAKLYLKNVLVSILLPFRSCHDAGSHMGAWWGHTCPWCSADLCIYQNSLHCFMAKYMLICTVVECE